MDRRPKLVAEVSGNHLGSLVNAMQLVRAIASSGVRYVKFQTYTADSMTIDSNSPDFRVGVNHELWGGRTLYDLYTEAHTPWEWHEQLFDLSRDLGMVPFSTPFDVEAVDDLETLTPALYKIASLEIGDLPLVRRVAETRKPLILSTGAATLKEIDEAVEAANQAGCSDLTLLLCTSSYPTDPGDVHLARMHLLRDRYDLPVGLSDHTRGIGVSIAAVALGATVIERHVTLNRAEGGPDAAFSLEPHELAALVVEVDAVARAIGEADWVQLDAEDESRRLKRSLYITEDCQSGDVLTPLNVRSIRPNGGLPPSELGRVLGRRLACAATRGTPLTTSMLEPDHSG